MDKWLTQTSTRQSGDSESPDSNSQSQVSLLSALALELESGCYQPDTDSINVLDVPVQVINGKRRRMQPAWFKRYPWLHYSRHLSAVLCFSCAKATALSLTGLSCKIQQTFITKGFSDWKKAMDKFADHEKCSSHRHAVMPLYGAALCGQVKIIIANAIKSLPSFLTVNHTDSDIGHLKHCVQIFQSASYITVHLAFLQLEEFPMPLIQLNY